MPPRCRRGAAGVPSRCGRGARRGVVRQDGPVDLGLRDRTYIVTGASAGLGFALSSSVKSPINGLAISNGLRPGLAMVAKTLADELGPNGTRVNGLMPGRIATDRLTELDGRSGDPEAARRASEKTIPLRRY